MPRNFNGTSDLITCTGAGALIVFGPATCAAIIKRNSPHNGVYDAIFSAGTGTTWELIFSPSDDPDPDEICVAIAGSIQPTTLTVTPTDGWCLIAGSKTTGTTQVRCHKVPLTAGVAASHQNVVGSIANSASPATSVYLGGSIASAGDFSKTDIAIIGVWNVVLTDAQIEALAVDLAAWFTVQPKGLWLLDQGAVAQKVNDMSGGGANESARSGTTISTSMPGWNYGV